MKITKWASLDQQLQALGERLNQLRILQGKTNEDLEQVSGVGRATLSRLWAGKPVKTDTLLRVLAALNEWAVIEQLIEPVSKPVRPLERDSEEKPLSERERVRKPGQRTAFTKGPLFSSRRK